MNGSHKWRNIIPTIVGLMIIVPQILDQKIKPKIFSEIKSYIKMTGRKKWNIENVCMKCNVS